ncbi:MAG: hypothetical protein EWV91_07065 [Microcystis aeruginosa Ma_QC_Ca_00000000_S207]|uniref:Water stress and hypersensitive response domain-containing protein n=1 Tax=Microcystis aeruginosa Ma_QC_Ca_00000000_S207 TaxID=2486251 RepID=A0A552FSW3_MICAE|nr:MAG: hypothetical protein EWV91_07065 [Microcystis aeruginosa Ma_QC_Ca_00000000_S207]
MWKKVLVGLGVGTGAFVVYNYFRKLNNDSAKLESVVSVGLEKLSLAETIITLDVKVKNPTTSTFNIKYPHIRLMYKDFLIGSSQVINQDITLPAFGEAMFNKITFKVSVLKTLTTGYKMVTALLNGEPIALTVQTISTILLAGKQLPYEKTEEIILKQ